MKHVLKILSLLLFACLVAFAGKAQSATDTIVTNGFVTEYGDTAIIVFLDDFVKTDKLPRRLAKRREYNNRLRYNVYKVYPYALVAADLLKDVDVRLEQCKDKKERKQYLKSVEKELNKRFKGEITDLTITQGQILVKLINRQTGKNCYSIIKELKGGFSAVVWQSVALIFSNSLKREYDPEGDDVEIEGIVKELEVNNYYQYQLQAQRQQGKIISKR